MKTMDTSEREAAWLADLPAVRGLSVGARIGIVEFPIQNATVYPTLLHDLLRGIDGLEVLGRFAVDDRTGVVFVMVAHDDLPPMQLGRCIVRVRFIVLTTPEGSTMRMETMPRPGGDWMAVA